MLSVNLNLYDSECLAAFGGFVSDLARIARNREQEGRQIALGHGLGLANAALNHAAPIVSPTPSETIKAAPPAPPELTVAEARRQIVEIVGTDEEKSKQVKEFLAAQGATTITTMTPDELGAFVKTVKEHFNARTE